MHSVIFLLRIRILIIEIYAKCKTLESKCNTLQIHFKASDLYKNRIILMCNTNIKYCYNYYYYYDYDDVSDTLDKFPLSVKFSDKALRQMFG